MNSDVIRTEVASVRVGAPQEFSPVLAHFNFGADPEAISVGRLQPNQEPVIVVQEVRLVQQQARRAIVVGNHNVNCAVVVNVAKGRAAAHFGKGKSWSCDSSHLSKFPSVTLVAK